MYDRYIATLIQEEIPPPPPEPPIPDSQKWRYLLVGLLLASGLAYGLYSYFSEALPAEEIFQFQSPAQVRIGDTLHVENRTNPADTTNIQFKWTLEDSRQNQYHSDSNSFHYTIPKFPLTSNESFIILQAQNRLSGLLLDRDTQIIYPLCANPPIIEGDIEISSPDGETRAGIDLTFSVKADTSRQVEYTWDFGDGNQSNAPRAIHRFERADKYIIRLTLKDLSTNIKCETSNSVVLDLRRPAPEPIISMPTTRLQTDTNVGGWYFYRIHWSIYKYLIGSQSLVLEKMVEAPSRNGGRKKGFAGAVSEAF